MYRLLSSVYDEYEWLPWRFDKCPKDFWGDKQNRIKYIEWAEKELGIKEKNDWLKIKANVSWLAFFFLSLIRNWWKLMEVGY